jgi:hypothetical protein
VNETRIASNTRKPNRLDCAQNLVWGLRSGCFKGKSQTDLPRTCLEIQTSGSHDVSILCFVCAIERTDVQTRDCARLKDR